MEFLEVVMNLEKPVNLEKAKESAGPDGLETKIEVEKRTSELIASFNHKINQEPFLGRWTETVSTEGSRAFSILSGTCVKWRHEFNNSDRSYKASFRTLNLPDDGTDNRGAIELVVEEHTPLRSRLKGVKFDFPLDD